ncbi:MAG: hydroxymethylglutaryl-CoA lyase [Cyclobacteriaceae bacterium]
MKIIECPRDAMQGLHDFIPTEEKAAYLNQLLKVGFDTIDFGSFVSPKAIPQLRDTAEVLRQLKLGDSKSKLLAIVANERGAKDAASFSEIRYQGFPLSLSDTFQQRNTNKSIDEALDTVASIQEICLPVNQKLVVYLSMGFGNPYGDPYDTSYISAFVQKLDRLGITIISLADTIGVATPEIISNVFPKVQSAYPHIEFGAHLHSNLATAIEKVKAAYEAGCRRIDSAILGIGGCPMAKDELVGNLATETLLGFLSDTELTGDIDQSAWSESLRQASMLFDKYN